MKGYYKMFEEMEYVLKDGWLYMGDLVKCDEDGYFYIVDRKKDMIFVGGYNVYFCEVEEVFYSYEGIKEVVVIGVFDVKMGEVVYVYIVFVDGELIEQVVFDYCEQYLVKYKCLVEVIFFDEILKNVIGKLLRWVVWDMFLK